MVTAELRLSPTQHPLQPPLGLVAWRPEQEQAVITHTVLNGIVVRPTMLYGRSGSIFEMVFKQAKEGKVTWYGTPGGKLALIHTDDLADLYVRLAEGAVIAGGKTFDASNPVSEDVDGFLKKLSQLAGLGGEYEYKKPTTGEFILVGGHKDTIVMRSLPSILAFEVALSATLLVRPYLGRSLLGWQPKKIGLTDGLETYYAAYLATL